MCADIRTSFAGGGRAARTLCLLMMTGEGMWINKFQVVLTLLTMAVGSLALSLTYFLGDGARLYLWRDMEQLMGEWVIASPAARYDSRMLKSRLSSEFTSGDLEFARDNVRHARLVEPLYQGTVSVDFGAIDRTMVVDGVTATLGREPLFRPRYGRGFSDEGWRTMVWECMLTESAVTSLGIDPGGDATVLVDNHPFHVVGVTPDPPDADPILRSRVIVPYGSAQELWIPFGTVGEILVAWSSPQFMNEVVDDLHRALDTCRGEETYFLSSSQFRILKSRSIIANVMVYGQMQALFCIAIAFVGVMNVMLTSTARRSNEFAIRLSMGAKQATILTIVLLESCFIGLAGALLGIALSAAVAPYAAGVLQVKINGASRLLPYYGLRGVLLPLLVCGLAGLAAGIMPALRVRKLDVLACLRNTC